MVDLDLEGPKGGMNTHRARAIDDREDPFAAKFEPSRVGGEFQMFGLEVLLHVSFARGSGQRQHADLHGKPKNDLSGTRT